MEKRTRGVSRWLGRERSGGLGEEGGKWTVNEGRKVEERERERQNPAIRALKITKLKIELTGFTGQLLQIVLGLRTTGTTFSVNRST